MAAKEISVKKYVVRLSGEERERLEALLRKGKSPAQRMLKARILLKADVSEAGEGWSDSRIIKALDTSVSMVYRVRKQLAEEGFEAVLSRKQRATPAVARIFDGEKEAKLIALACSKPPKGRARWTLRLLEKKVVELQIVDCASDLTIGRALKKTSLAPSPAVLGHPAEGQWRVRSRHGRCAGGLHAATRSRLPAGVPGRDLQQFLAETRLPIPMKRGRPARCDYEYECSDTAVCALAAARHATRVRLDLQPRSAPAPAANRGPDPPEGAPPAAIFPPGHAAAPSAAPRPRHRPQSVSDALATGRGRLSARGASARPCVISTRPLPYSPIAHNASKNSIKTGIKSGTKSGRALRQVAGTRAKVACGPALRVSDPTSRPDTARTPRRLHIDDAGVFAAIRVLEQATTTVARFCPIEKCLPVVDQLARRREDLVRRADVHVTVLVEREVLPTEGPILAFRLVDHRDMRSDVLVFDKPFEFAPEP